MSLKLPQIGIVGLGAMAENLVLNVEGRGYSVALYNRTYEKVERFLKERCEGRKIHGYRDLRTFVDSLDRPRIVILMVKAGRPVDDYIGELKRLLGRNDVLIDFGNSHFKDSDRRQEELNREGIGFLGCGVSGGVEGALRGPSIMAGGDPRSYELVKELFVQIAAHYDGDPCVDYFGRGGAGHFVKIVHNGIEYSMLGAISEVYAFLKDIAGLDNQSISMILSEWNGDELNSFLLEATSHVVGYREEGQDRELIELIIDEAEQKGTGRWASEAAKELGVPTPCIDAALTSRYISQMREMRRVLAEKFGRKQVGTFDRERAVRIARAALYCTYVLSYSEGLSLLERGSSSWGYDATLAKALAVWRAGCIIRSKIVQTAHRALLAAPDVDSDPLFAIEPFESEIKRRLEDWKEFINASTSAGMAIPTISSAYNYFLSMTTARLPANVIQGIRDYFGWHGFRRFDKEGEFHSMWGR